MSGSEGIARFSLGALLFGRMSPAGLDIPTAQADPAARSAAIEEAANIFKTLGHEGRLLILCHLAQGERSVGELEGMLDARQSAVSQQLARLRIEGLVTARRDGKTIYYSLRDPRIGELLMCYARIFGNSQDRPA
ncbi:MAG TPA: metalloregulator ArsR/SmtB family transcription factor [Paracoccus sp. (in: a-proteobacteria)]|uniref:ArsR/SmtB family transcription factor n=1 Tax=Paracoccus sp. TaxID=267 RepID=UPI002BF724C4|nr:metalloregulator ArsR/SmtB family transcription factor [Paracoccus sp. (in: a-proteobacteria)]HWL55847.1 metalloregulator ArsR/SmtB family transcription factor [Paracoccus sp. (in: a-proteobacteria)]